MRRVRRWGLAATAGLVVVLFATAHASPQSAAGIAHFRQATVSYTSQGVYPGATEVWRTNVKLLHKPQTVGTGGVACIHVTAEVRECFGTYVLPLGRIKVLGEITNRGSYQLAIVGGLGSYAGASGVASFTPGLATFFIT